MTAKSPEAIEAAKNRTKDAKSQYKADDFVKVQSFVHESQRGIVLANAVKLRKIWRKQNRKVKQNAQDSL